MSAASEARLPDAEGMAVRLHRRGFWWLLPRRLLRQPVTVGALALLLAILLTGALAQQIVPEGWNFLHLTLRWRNQPPTWAGGNVMGTDVIGRSVLTRTIWGLHFTEEVAVVGALAAVAVGLLVGLLAGYFGGLLDAALMRFADLVSGFPVLLLLIIAFIYFEPVTVWKASLIFAFSLWVFVARVVRARVASLREEEFVQAARALGASDRRIVFRHLLPNTAGAMVVSWTSLIGQIVIVEATAEYFGFGVNSANRPTLGNLIAEAAGNGIGGTTYVAQGWWVWATPMFALVLLLVCVNLVGDGLEAALDPRRNRL